MLFYIVSVLGEILLHTLQFNLRFPQITYVHFLAQANTLEIFNMLYNHNHSQDRKYAHTHKVLCHQHVNDGEATDAQIGIKQM